MIIQLDIKAEKKEIEDFIYKLENEYKFAVSRIDNSDYILLHISGDVRKVEEKHFEAYTFVKKVSHIQEPYVLASRSYKQDKTQIQVGDVVIGGEKKIVMAGPCAVESQEQIDSIGKFVIENGADIIRGGVSKPRTSPYSFQGLNSDGLELFAKTKEKVNAPIITEIVSPVQIEEFMDTVDIFQVGARNMQNYELLKALGKIDKPIMLKRGLSATVEEWLLAAEYILSGGNQNVMLCERGIRTFETEYRNVLDLNAVVALKQMTHLPIIVDPSHACGKWWMVADLCKAALACGADGIIMEVHNEPEKALSDGGQSLRFDTFKQLMNEVECYR